MATIAVPASGYFEYAPYVVKTYLLTKLPSEVKIATDEPKNRPERFIQIISGITRSEPNPALSQRRCIIRCWDRNELLACRMAEKVRGFLVDATHVPGNGIRAVDVVGEPAYYPDPADPANSPRAQLTVDITLRATFAL